MVGFMQINVITRNFLMMEFMEEEESHIEKHVQFNNVEF